MCLAPSFGHFQGNEAISFYIMLCVLFSGNFHTREGVTSVISQTESASLNLTEPPAPGTVAHPWPHISFELEGPSEKWHLLC